MKAGKQGCLPYEDEGMSTETVTSPETLADLLERAAVLKVGVVQVADNLPLHALDSIELRDARDQALSLGLRIEIGTRGVEPAHLLRYLRLAVSFDAALLRTLTRSVEQQPSLERAEKWIREVLPERRLLSTASTGITTFRE